MKSLGHGKVIVTKPGGMYEINVQGTFGGGYTKRAKETDVIDETAHALSYALYGRRPVELIAPDEIKLALEKRGYDFHRGQALSVYLAGDLIVALKIKAEAEHRSVSEIVEDAVRTSIG
jgi:hypothetical protein